MALPESEHTEGLRTWTLANYEWMFDDADGPEVEGPALSSTPVKVIELEPVLDLLEEWFSLRPTQSTNTRTLALLREHGRLNA